MMQARILWSDDIEAWKEEPTLVAVLDRVHTCRGGLELLRERRGVYGTQQRWPRSVAGYERISARGINTITTQQWQQRMLEKLRQEYQKLYYKIEEENDNGQSL